MVTPRNYYRMAFLKWPNLVFLGLGVGVSALFVSIWPVTVVAGLSAVYTALLGKSKWFRRRIRHEYGWGGGLITPQERERQASALSDNNAIKYIQLRKTYRKACERAEEDFAQDPTITTILAKMETLSDTYLAFLLDSQRLANHVTDDKTSALKEELAALEQKLDAAEDAETREIRAQQIDMVKQRIAAFEDGGKTVKRITAQMELIEQSANYLHDGVMTMDKPLEIGTQVDNLMMNLTDARKTIGEIESLALTATPVQDDLPAALRQRQGQRLS